MAWGCLGGPAGPARRICPHGRDVASLLLNGLRDYGVDGQIGLEESPDEWVARLVDVFREVRRVLRRDGVLFIEIGDSYNTATSASRVGSTLEGSHGYWSNPHIKTRLAIRDLKPKDLLGQPWLLAFALRADGWYLRSEIIWHKLNAMPESVSDRPTKAHSTVFLLSKRPRYYFDAEAIREPHQRDGRKVTTVVGQEGSLQHRHGERWPGTGANARSVWPLATEPYSARALGHGTYYRASADCPTHGLQADRQRWLEAERDGRSAFADGHRIDGNDARLALAQADADASSESRTPESRFVATARSTETSRTGRGPATSPSCTPSARTTPRTGDTSASPESSAHGDRTPGSNTEEASLCAPREPGPSAETQSRSARRCTCEKVTTDHFATWPQALVRKMILAGTSERGVCPECGAPWVRETAESHDAEGRTTNGPKPRTDERRGFDVRMVKSTSTLGWSPSCDHDADPIPAVVIDPFAGSGTTCLVARKLGRHAVGIDLNADYCALAAERLAQQSLLTEASA